MGLLQPLSRCGPMRTRQAAFLFDSCPEEHAPALPESVYPRKCNMPVASLRQPVLFAAPGWTFPVPAPEPHERDHRAARIFRGTEKGAESGRKIWVRTFFHKEVASPLLRDGLEMGQPGVHR